MGPKKTTTTTPRPKKTPVTLIPAPCTPIEEEVPTLVEEVLAEIAEELETSSSDEDEDTEADEWVGRIQELGWTILGLLKQQDNLAMIYALTPLGDHVCLALDKPSRSSTTSFNCWNISSNEFPHLPYSLKTGLVMCMDASMFGAALVNQNSICTLVRKHLDTVPIEDVYTSFTTSNVLSFSSPLFNSEGLVVACPIVRTYHLVTSSPQELMVAIHVNEERVHQYLLKTMSHANQDITRLLNQWTNDWQKFVDMMTKTCERIQQTSLKCLTKRMEMESLELTESRQASKKTFEEQLAKREDLFHHIIQMNQAFAGMTKEVEPYLGKLDESIKHLEEVYENLPYVLK